MEKRIQSIDNGSDGGGPQGAKDDIGDICNMLAGHPDLGKKSRVLPVVDSVATVTGDGGEYKQGIMFITPRSYGYCRHTPSYCSHSPLL